jgi:hypothetical protein
MRRTGIESRMIMIMESDDQPHDQATFSHNWLENKGLRRRKSRMIINT